MVRQKLISLKDMIKKLVYIGINKGNADYLEDLQKERYENVFERSFENSIYYTIFGIFFISISVIILFYSLFIEKLSDYFLVSSLIVEFIGIALLFPLLS